MKNLRKKLMKLEYLNEVCVHSPALLIDTKCGVGRYKFNKIGYQNDKLIIEVKLLGGNTLVHLSVVDKNNEQHLHVKIPGINYFEKNQLVNIFTDVNYSFIFEF